MLFKICGLKEINTVEICEKNKVDFFGMIFYEKSPRYITLKKAKELVDFSKNKKITPVGVFVNKDLEVVHKLIICMSRLKQTKEATQILEANLQHFQTSGAYWALFAFYALGEKKYETLISKEEMLRTRTYGNFYIIRPDIRDLNYSKYFTKGEKNIQKVKEYNSNNTKVLNSHEIVKLLKRINIDRYVKD